MMGRMSPDWLQPEDGLKQCIPSMEGMHCFNPSSGCNQSGLILPIIEYNHSEGNAVIGGFVYHGSNIPSLQGIYFFADFGTGKIWELRETSPNNWTRTLI